MRMSRQRGTPRRPSRWASVIGAISLAASLAACSSGPPGIVINLYGGTSDTKFDKIVAQCKQGRRAGNVIGNLLPSDADSQREQLVRRLAAHDSGMDVLGMDVTWTAEFAEAGWIRELTGTRKQQAAEDVTARAGHRDVEGQALRDPEAHQRPAVLVPQVAHPEPAEDLGPGDRRREEAEVRGQATRRQRDRPAVRGLRGAVQHGAQLAGRHDRQRRQHQGHDRRQDRPGAADPPRPRHQRGGEPVDLGERGARGVRADPARRGGLRDQLALRLRR